MRGRIAAACAALLVGLAPAGVLLSTPWVTGAQLICLDESPARDGRREISAVPELVEPGPRAPTAIAGSRELGAVEIAFAAPLIWRSPSGPAPSTAPPRAAAARS